MKSRAALGVTGVSGRLGTGTRRPRRLGRLIAVAIAIAAGLCGCAAGEPTAAGDAPVGFSWTRDEEAGAAGEATAPAGETEEEAAEAVGEAVAPDTVDFGATDATSALHSSATAFDTSRAWPLSREREVAALVGEGVASRLLDDLNDYLAPAGAEVGSALDVMVSEDGVNRSGATVRFRIMAYHAADRIVVDCAYDEESGRHAFARQP